MEYSLYWWHILMHRVPVLWRCHAPHHADLDLDVTTALRFHFGEFLASIPWRCAQRAGRHPGRAAQRSQDIGGPFDAGAMTHAFKFNHECKRADLGVASFVQDPRSGDTLQVLPLAFCR